MEGFFEFDHSIDVSDPRKDVSTVIDRLRPAWKDDWVMEKLVATGNDIYKCKLPTDEEDGETILVRVYSNFAAKIYDLENYVTIMRVVAAQGLCAEVLGRVNNGLVYRYTQGERLYDTEYLKDDTIIKEVAKELAKIHKVKPNDFLRSHGRPASISEDPVLFSRIDNYLSFMPDDLTQLGNMEDIPIKTKQELINEVELVKKKFLSGSNKVVLNHGDAITGNIIYNKNTGKIQCIDYEATGYNYDSYDLTNFLYVRFAFNVIDGKIKGSFVPETRETQLMFIRAYFEALNQASEVSDPEVEEMYEKCRVMNLALLLYRAILCYRLVSITKLSIVDLMRFGNDHVIEYFNRKEAVMEHA